MSISARVDVVVAEVTPSAPAPVVDDAADHERVVVLAANKTEGLAAARALGIDPVAVVTPRALDAAHGVEADRIIEADGLSEEVRDQLMQHAAPSVATAPSE